MGLALRPYAVDLKELEKIFASGKSGLIDEIVNQNKDLIYEMEAWSSSDMEIKEGLNDILNGQIKKNEGEIYALATELLCRYLGNALSNKYWDDVSMNWLMEVNLKAEMPIRKLPLPKDFPYVLSILNSEIDDFFNTMNSLDIEEPLAKDEFLQWKNYLILNNKDLVLYFY